MRRTSAFPQTPVSFSLALLPIDPRIMSKNKRTPPWKPEANDVIIPLMGPTGAGKSTFINFIAGKEVTTVGHDLKSCTSGLLPVVIDSLPINFPKDRRLVLVDTPGFGDTFVDDAEILHRIGSWLEDMYDRGSNGHKGETKLAGIVYLHDISLTRMLGSTRKNLDVFQKLCGEDALNRVVLCTTMWSDIYKEDGERRTEQLEKSYWKEMIDGGSTVCKFEDSQKSAWDAITSITESVIEEDQIGRMDALQIQEELVEAKRLIPDTEAGRQLRYSLDQLLKSLKQASSKDPSRRKELNVQIAAIRDQIKTMRVPVTQRMSRLLDSTVDKILDKFMHTNATPSPPSPFTDNTPIVSDVGARLTADAKDLIMLLGETETSYKKLLELSAAKITNFGGDEQATTQVRCWSVERNLKPLFVVAAPSFDSHQGDNAAIFKEIRTWLGSSCREDMQFGIIFLRNSVDPPPSDHVHAERALKLVKQSRLKSNTLFATFASEATGTVEYGFDGSVASFQETSGEALKMLDTAVKNPVRLGLLLEEVQTISEGGCNMIMLLGETEASYERLITLLDAKMTNWGSDKPDATTEVRCWYVDRKNLKPLLLVAAPSFVVHKGGDSAIFEKVRTWLTSSCCEGMQFGIIYLRSQVHQLSSEHFHACPALGPVNQSGLKSNTLFASFAGEGSGTVKYGFDGSVASFQETREQALKMFDIALDNPVKLGSLLKELQIISEGAFNMIMLLGETETLYKTLLKTLPGAKITIFGSDEKAITEVRCWSVRRENSQPLLLVAAPSFDSHQAGDPAIIEKVRTWLKSSCRKDMQFGIICLLSRVHPSPSRAVHALKLLKKSKLRSNILFAIFASEANTVEYGFDNSPAPERGQALEMLKLACSKPVRLGHVLEELQTTLEGAINRKGFEGFFSQLRLRREAEGLRPNWAVRKD